MSRTELRQLYRNYLEDIAEMPGTRYSLSYSHKKGVLHGIGIALGYDYETVEQDIKQAGAAELDPLPGQIRLAI